MTLTKCLTYSENRTSSVQSIIGATATRRSIGFTSYRFEVVAVATDGSAIRSPVVTSKRTCIPRRVATITRASSVNCSILPFKSAFRWGTSKTQTGGHTRLGHPASLHRLFNPDHEFGAQSKVPRLGLPEAQISEYIAAATQHLVSVRHRYGISRNFAIISLHDHCSKPAASDWGDADSPASATRCKHHPRFCSRSHKGIAGRALGGIPRSECGYPRTESDHRYRQRASRGNRRRDFQRAGRKNNLPKSRSSSADGSIRSRIGYFRSLRFASAQSTGGSAPESKRC